MTTDDFLRTAGWSGATRSPLAGDASARRYLRLDRDGARAVLMIAPPGPEARTDAFVTLARTLAAAGLSAPRLLAADTDNGLVLMEDLGDAVLARLLDTAPEREGMLYAAAIEAMLTMQALPLPDGLAAPDAATLAALTEPAATWYAAPAGIDAGALASRLAAALKHPLGTVLAEAPRVLAHRDFHAENLIWLPERRGPARIGLLDFQDAFAAPPAYDLVSLLEDARRDVTDATRAAAMRQAAAAMGVPPERLARDCAILGAQRNLRILGVFARLARRDGKGRYVDLIPRVWRHLARDLAHPALADLAQAAAALPAPDALHLDRLREPCQTAPTP